MNVSKFGLYIKKEKFNKKILSIEHGGAHQIDSHQFDYENKFCNGYISWIRKQFKEYI